MQITFHLTWRVSKRKRFFNLLKVPYFFEGKACFVNKLDFLSENLFIHQLQKHPIDTSCKKPRTTKLKFCSFTSCKKWKNQTSNLFIHQLQKSRTTKVQFCSFKAAKNGTTKYQICSFTSCQKTKQPSFKSVHSLAAKMSNDQSFNSVYIFAAKKTDHQA